jgi:hypothetical protein
VENTMNTKQQQNDTNWVEQIGQPAYSAIVEMVAALQADRDRLEELRDERDSWEPESDEERRAAKRPFPNPQTWAEAFPEDDEELAELVAAVTLDGEEIDEDEARQRIDEDPLSLRIFGEKTDGEWEATSYELLLTTGGPAVRIVGDLNGSEASSARLEVQDWGKPWTEYFQTENDTLMAYVGCFYFGE